MISAPASANGTWWTSREYKSARARKRIAHRARIRSARRVAPPKLVRQESADRGRTAGGAPARNPDTSASSADCCEEKHRGCGLKAFTAQHLETNKWRWRGTYTPTVTRRHRSPACTPAGTTLLPEATGLAGRPSTRGASYDSVLQLVSAT